jgi:hypothetical protein
MLKLLERNIATIEQRLVLVAPPAVAIPRAFQRVRMAPGEHRRLVREVQRMRGTVYLEDGAVQRHQLSPEGLHQTPEDERSWHLLFTNEHRHVTACAWFLQHDVQASFEDLRVRHSPLARAEEWRSKLWYAVEFELARARAEGLSYAEVGGWAVTKESRCTSEGLLLALAAYSLGRKLGGALGMTTATVRHSSSAILRRLGGAPLQAKREDIPAYHDPKYGCTMEILGFDSRHPNRKYAPLVELLHGKLTTVPIIASTECRVPIEPPARLTVPFYAA